MDNYWCEDVYVPEAWLDENGKPVACNEKIKVLNQNLQEILDVCFDAIEDASLMGCDPEYYRRVLVESILSLGKASH